MKTLKRVSITILVLTVTVVGVYFWAYNSIYPTSEVHEADTTTSQINRVLANKNSDKLKEISQNDSTYKFLKKLPVRTKAVRTSGYQGSENGLDYLCTRINHKSMDVYVKQVNSSTWKLKYLALQ